MKKSRKKQNFFVYNYSKCWKFLNEARWHITFSLAIFMLFFLIGFTLPIFFREEIINFMKEMVRTLEGKNTIEIISYIFFNNLKAAFFALVLGVGIGFFPLLTTVVNGYVLGFASRFVATEEGIAVLWRLLPHGIFELPAISLAIGIGIKMGFDLFEKKNRKKRLIENFREGLRFFVFVIIPLLIVAAIIEGTLIGLGV